MNYYEHHIGDYAEATSHLSFIEDAAYSRLIRKYYAQEKPLPAELKAVQRLVGARTKEEREAVDTVLKEFFELEEDGWHNGRCDAELQRYLGKTEGKDAKRENERERQRRHRQRRKELFDALREYGEVPPFDTPTNDLETLLSHVTSRAVTQPVTRDATANQTPDTSHHTPDTKTQADDDTTDSGSALSSPDPEIDLPPGPDFDPPPAAPLPMREQPPVSDDPAVILSVALRRQGVNCMSTHPTLQDWAAKGVSLELLTEAVALAREVKGKASIPPNYLVPIVEKLLNPPAAAAPGAKPKANDWEWKRSDQGITNKGRELGMFARGGESYRDFAARIETTLAKRKGQP